MPWDGSGGYAPPAASFPEVNGTVIDADRYNPTILDLAAGIEASLAKNGENAATANLAMGGFVLTGLGAGAAAGNSVRWEQVLKFGYSDIASASTTELGNSGNGVVRITGTTTITAFGLTAPAGAIYHLVFAGALTLTHHATDLILPSGANITTAAGDCATFHHYASGDWRCLAYTKADGTALLASSLFPDGSVSAPGLRFANDTNTGIYRTGSDSIGIALGGTKVVDFTPVTLALSTDLRANGGDVHDPSVVFSSTANSVGLYGSASVVGVSDGATSAIARFDKTNTRVLLAYKLRLEKTLEFDNSEGSPTVSAGGGTGVAIAGSNSAFVITIGTGSPTSVTVDFSATRPDTPIPIVSSSQSGLILHVSAISTTQIQIQSSAAMNNGTKIYCLIAGYV